MAGKIVEGQIALVSEATNVCATTPEDHFCAWRPPPPLPCFEVRCPGTDAQISANHLPRARFLRGPIPSFKLCGLGFKLSRNGSWQKVAVNGAPPLPGGHSRCVDHGVSQG